MYFKLIYTQSVKMTAKEERAYRNISRKCSEAEMRGGLFRDLIKARVGLKEVEDDVRKEGVKFKGGGKFAFQKGREIVVMFMREKLKDNKVFGVSVCLVSDFSLYQCTVQCSAVH